MCIRDSLGSECIYSMTCDFGAISVKSQDDVMERDVTVYVKYSNLYIFDAESNRAPLDETVRRQVEEISARVREGLSLIHILTVRQNIEFGLENKKIPKEERRKLVEEISETVGLTPYLDRKPSKLSGGQRQRVALARAMVKKPKVFQMCIRDRPWSAAMINRV